MIISLDALQEYDRRPAETVEVVVRFVKQIAVVASCQCVKSRIRYEPLQYVDVIWAGVEPMHETEILNFETRVGCYARGLLSKGWEARADLAKDRDGIVIGSLSGKVPIRPNWDVTRGEKLTGECKGRQQQRASSH
jgi:hypothetical protein